MKIYHKVLFVISAALAGIALYWLGPPSRFANAEDLCVWYSAAILPPAFSAIAATLAKERNWAYRTVLAFWSIGVMSTILCLSLWHTDAWAPALWVCSSGVWFVAAAILVVFGGVVRFLKRKDSNHALQATAAPPPRS